MKVISQFVVRVCDLIEAEGRTLRSVIRHEAAQIHAHAQAMIANLLLGSALLVLAVCFVIAGFGLIAMGLLRWLEPLISQPAALVLSGLGGASLGCVCFYIFRKVAAGDGK